MSRSGPLYRHQPSEEPVKREIYFGALIYYLIICNLLKYLRPQVTMTLWYAPMFDNY